MSQAHGNEVVSDAEILERIDEIPEPVASAAEIATKFPISRTAINKRLNRLYDGGDLNRKDVGGGYVYWLPD